MSKLPFSNRLGSRLLGFILLFSSLVTLVTTGIQLYTDYRKDISVTEKIVQQTSKSHLSNLATNLWSVDLRKIEFTLKGIVQLPDIEYLEISDKANVLIRVGKVESTDVFTQTFPLVYEERFRKEHLGSLKVVTGYQRVRQNLLSKVFIIMGTQAAKTFLVSLFILLLFRLLVTRHLVNMAHFAESLDFEKLDTPLKLNRKINEPTQPDELDLVVQAWNRMRLSLQNSLTELKTNNQRLLEMDRLKDQFLANTSHELRTPLNGIVGLVESLLEGASGAISSKVRHHLSMVHSCGRRLYHLVDDILDFSKLKNRDIELTRTPIDLSSAVNAVLALSKPLAGSKPVQLVNAIPDGQPPVYADENRLMQILHNIIGNAVKFTASGTVEVSASQQDTYLKVIVTDTGIGISPENMKALFMSFEQGDGSTTKKYPGMGLGLNISKKLIELHGGKIQVESGIGVGTVVSLFLPLSEKPLPDEVRESSIFQRVNPMIDRFSDAEAHILNQSSADKNFFKILVVDDDLVVRQVLSNYLTLEKFNIFLAESGQEALEMIEQNRPDIVLLDIMMPNMDGFEVCHRIRERYLSCELPVIFLSARKELKDRLQGMSLAANDYLEKPVFKHELVARVQNQISILIANRRLNSLLDLSQRIGKFKDAKDLVKYAFQILDRNIFINGGILNQGETIVTKSGDKKSRSYIENEIIPTHKPLETVQVVPVEGNLPGYLIYFRIRGFEEFTLCLFRKKINGDYQKADIRFLNTLVSEINLIRSNIKTLSYKQGGKEEIQKINQHLEHILYLEADKSSCQVYFSNQLQPQKLDITMQEIELYFGGYELIRVHRRFFVLPDKVDSVIRKKSKDFDLLIGHHRIPIGRTYLKKFREKHSYLFG